MKLTQIPDEGSPLMGSLEISVIGLAPPCGCIQRGEKGAEFSCIKFVEPAVATCLFETFYGLKNGILN